MAQMKIYGSPMSRASRVMWCAKELGVPFDHIDVPWDKIKDPSFLAVNPNGKVPALVDGTRTLWESNAILRYIAARHGGDAWWPSDPVARAVAADPAARSSSTRSESCRSRFRPSSASVTLRTIVSRANSDDLIGARKAAVRALMASLTQSKNRSTHGIFRL